MNYKNIISAFALSAILISCNDQDEITDRNVKPVLTASQTTYTVTEGDDVVVTLTADTPHRSKMDLKVELIGGTGTSGDFTCSGTETSVEDGWGMPGYKIAFPAYASTSTFTITPTFDLLPEGTETLQFRLTSAGNGIGLVADNSQIINVTVANKTSNNFYTEFQWSGTYLDGAGAEHELCDYDFDLEIYDENFNVIDDSYSSCPEAITLDAATTPDALYYIVPSFWTNVGPVAPAAPISFQTTLVMSKPGVWYREIEINDLWKSNLGGAAQGFADAYFVAASLTKTGNTYVLEDADGNPLESGRSASLLNSIKSNKKNKK